MDDFDEIYNERQKNFDAGKQKGTDEANNYQMQEFAKEGHEFGAEFVKELAMYESFLQVFQRLSISLQLKNQKSQQLAIEIRTIMNEIDYQSLQVLKEQRAALEKKFEMFMARLGIKKSVTRQLFQIKKVKVSIDF